MFRVRASGSGRSPASGAPSIPRLPWWSRMPAHAPPAIASSRV